MIEMNKGTAVRPLVKLARIIFVVLAWLFLAFIASQIFIAGLGLFVDSDNWELHKSLPQNFSFVPLVMLAAAFLGKLPVHIRWICLGLFLMVVAQFLTVIFSSDIGMLSALHPVIAMLLFWGSLTTVKHGHKWRK
ncbi:DUF6220 domain-containing protein [Paenibacillus alkalitolerans]|uniref:DUF6220 domain-containing protein n=1 Tax=Paenibacillus alkalitolerans TaxID=2799335 RepID=UPI0018F75304|nr:DUF6220 domain-containing protein [Paenibacillus alkalitolerans]